MRLGVFSDVHGNLHALDAVLTDGRTAGVDRWWVLGDLVAIGPDPVATLERLANLADCEIIRGNTDRYVVTGDRPPPTADDVRADPRKSELFAAVESSFSWTRRALSAPGRLEWLEQLPLAVRMVLDDGTRLLGVHASPGRDDSDGIRPERPDAELAVELAGAEADVVIGGHTHRPTDRWIGATRALNGGSVSNPVTADKRAAYLVVHADRHGHRIERRRVSYDREAFVRRLDEAGHPEAAFIASFQRTG